MVDAWPTYDLAPAVQLHITRDMPALDPAIDAEVARHWSEATATRPLFNGRVFCADTITSTRIDGHWTEYRRITAQMRDPTLFARLQIRSLAVCGVLQGPDGIAVGRREPRSAYQAGLWQLPPAGSVDHSAAEPGGASWQRALLAELREELGLPAQAATTMRPLCLVQHPTGVLDMGIHIQTQLTAAEIIAHHQAQGDGEYDRLLVVPKPRLLDAVAAQGGTLVPSAQPFLDLIL